MPKGKNSKLKLYYLAEILLKYTDDVHYITMQDILEKLEEYEVTADRKTIYKDIEDLGKLGLVVEKKKIGKYYQYHVVEKQFELAELKLLVDAIQSSKFVTEKKTAELIGRLEQLASRYEAASLQRQVYTIGRIKAANEGVYYNVDSIHNAISENKKIRFQYYQWNEKKEMILRRDGKNYHISPWSLVWDDENYYLIGYDSEADKIKHYRVDKMLHIRISEDMREGQYLFDKIDMAEYTRKSFGMFGGKEQTVKLKGTNDMAGVILDRFGTKINLIPCDEEHFTVNVDVQVSQQFFGWVCSLGQNVKIVGPEDVTEQMKQHLEEVLMLYK